jgi:nitroreductase
MDIYKELFYKRRSRRALSDKKVERDKLKRMLDAARWAPSCFNNQPWHFVVIDEKESLEKAHEALWGGNYWVKRAPVLIAPVTEKESGCHLKDGRYSYLFDLGLAVENLILAGVSEGLIVHPFIGFGPDKIKTALQIPVSLEVPFLIAIGYQGTLDGLSDKHKEVELAERERKTFDEVVFWNGWKASD